MFYEIVIVFSHNFDAILEGSSNYSLTRVQSTEPNVKNHKVTMKGTIEPDVKNHKVIMKGNI
jgi:hypothetical protein